jgi:LPS O-antigen subunit length determinant protein (WzzB/FepE family)
MEIPDFKVEEILDLLVNKVKIAAPIEDEINAMIQSRLQLLDQDVVMKQRKRF